MDSSTQTGWSAGAQLNLLMLLTAVFPVVALVGLGAWAVSNIPPSVTSTNGLPAETLMWGVTFGLALLVFLGVAFAWLRMRSILRGQALELADVCRQVSSGDRSVRAPVHGDDEFAVLASAVNAFLDGTPITRSVSSNHAGGDAQDAAALQAQIEKLLQEVSAVGDGDLRVQAEVTPDTLGVLADSFNYMIEELAKVAGRVQATTFQVTNATRRLLDRSAEVAQASDAQAIQISQTTESVARLADFVQLSANNALAAAEAARDALKNADGGQTAVVQTIDGMVRIRENVQETSKKIKRLGERSQEVGEIVRLIEDIADQTNLLALNAAIQSAMAGEHGRGFAVVADEIRLLAERVTEATKRIATIVKSIQGDTYEAVVAMEESTQEVVKGSQLADQAGEALRSIYAAVDRQAKMIEGIAKAANERAQTSEAVAAAMTRIAEITRQTNSATQDTTAAVSYLAELAEQLRASVATFRLPEQSNEISPLLPQSDSAYPPALNLPGRGSARWTQEIPQLPALPPATAGALGGMGFGNEFDTGGYDYNSYTNGGYGTYYGPPPYNGVPAQQGYRDQHYNEDQVGGDPHPSDLYQ
ncbi:MAG: methyl-accepting chemotaxis protein [Ktedonobacterales bacterium]